MLRNATLYKYLFRIPGVFLLLWGCYQAYDIISNRTIEASEFQHHLFTRLGYLPFLSLLAFALIFGGLGYFTPGFLLVSFSSFNAKIFYCCILITPWLITFFLWYRHAFIISSGIYDNLWPYNATQASLLPWMGINFFCSIVIFAFRKHLIRFFRYIFASNEKNYH